MDPQKANTLRVNKLTIKGEPAREKGKCVFTVQGRLRQVGSIISYSGFTVHSDSLLLGGAEVQSSWTATIDFVYWTDATGPAGTGQSHQLKLNLFPAP